jgi:hypothetical protein
VKEFDIFIPLKHNDGTPIESRRFRDLKIRLLEYFNGLTFFPQANEGTWRMGDVTYEDEVVIYRVVASNARDARRFLRQLKEELKIALNQEEIFIVERDVDLL